MKIHLNTSHTSYPEDSILHTEMPVAFYKAGLSILAAQNYEQMYSKIVTEVKKLLKADYVSVYLVVNNELQKVHTSLSKLQLIKPRKGGFTYTAYLNSTPYVLDNREVFNIHPQIKQLNIPATLFIPLTFENEPMGVISVDFHTEVSFSPATLELLKVFGSIIAFRLKNLHLNEKLIQLTESQQLFMSLASHEIKNPLTTVLAYAQIVQYKLKRNESIEVAMVDKLISEVQRVGSLINEFLTTPTHDLQEANLQYQKGNHHVSDIVIHAVTNFKLNFKNHKVSVSDKSRGRDLISGDYQKLLQLFGNILSNAAKFSPLNSTIKIVLKSDEHICFITTADPGKGIPKNVLPHIFERYYKTKTSQQKGGMGLGLYLCKKIVEEHQGTITVTSQFRKGTTIEIQLPHII